MVGQDVGQGVGQGLGGKRWGQRLGATVGHGGAKVSEGGEQTGKHESRAEGVWG